MCNETQLNVVSFDKANINWFTGALADFVSGVNCNTDYHKLIMRPLISQTMLKKIEESGAQILIYGHPEQIIGTIDDTGDGNHVLLINAAHISMNAMMCSVEYGRVYVEEHLYKQLYLIDLMNSGRLVSGNGKATTTFDGQEYITPTNPNSMEYVMLPWNKMAHNSYFEMLVKKGHLSSVEEGWKALESNIHLLDQLNQK